MSDLIIHANRSTDIRRAAEFAMGISNALTEINRGPSFDHDRDKKVKEIEAWFLCMAEILGYEIKESA